ncbi:hypothetical protein TNCV_1308251 [Trichonephila clavipes]|nr:hypothetical protein TNCV_1308251 [Trichonephila clavipes]
MIWRSIMLDELMPLRVPSREYGPEESGSDLGDLCPVLPRKASSFFQYFKTDLLISVLRDEPNMFPLCRGIV